MKSNLSDAEWVKTLPKKRMGVAVLIFDEEGKMLVVKQSYKEKWSVTGGIVDAEESPRVAAIRETKEEIGIDLKEAIFLGMEYVPTEGESIEGLEFIFYGGVISPDEIAGISLEKEEIEEYRFMEVAEAIPILRPNLSRRVSIFLEVLRTGIPIYTEKG